MTTWKKEFKLPWREAGPPDHDDGKVDSYQQVVNQELSLRTLSLERDRDLHPPRDPTVGSTSQGEPSTHPRL